MKETETEYHLMPNPLATCDPVIVLKDSIEDQASSKVSPMPTGLLNTLHKHQILDLLAYVISGGDPKHPLYK